MTESAVQEMLEYQGISEPEKRAQLLEGMNRAAEELSESVAEMERSLALKLEGRDDETWSTRADPETEHYLAARGRFDASCRMARAFLPAREDSASAAVITAHERQILWTRASEECPFPGEDLMCLMQGIAATSGDYDAPQVPDRGQLERATREHEDFTILLDMLGWESGDSRPSFSLAGDDPSIPRVLAYMEKSVTEQIESDMRRSREAGEADPKPEPDLLEVQSVVRDVRSRLKAL